MLFAETLPLKVKTKLLPCSFADILHVHRKLKLLLLLKSLS